MYRAMVMSLMITIMAMSGRMEHVPDTTRMVTAAVMVVVVTATGMVVMVVMTVHVLRAVQGRIMRIIAQTQPVVVVL